MRFGERTRVGVPVRSWTKKTGDAPWGIAVLATGGSIGTITDTSSYTLLTYTGDGTFTVTSPGIFECLLIGAGGASGGNNGFGGEATGAGGGGSVFITTLYLPVGTYTVDVGGAGSAGAGGEDNPNLQNGNQSSIYNSTSPTFYALAEGGGGGASAWYNNERQPLNVGGASYRNGNNETPAGSNSQSPLCFNGGGASDPGDFSGGGAGAGGSASGSTAGIGRTTSFTGTSKTYGVGGGGGTTSAAGATNSELGSGGGGRQAGTTGNGTNGQGGAVYIRFRSN